MIFPPRSGSLRAAGASLVLVLTLFGCSGGTSTPDASAPPTTPPTRGDAGSDPSTSEAPTVGADDAAANELVVYPGELSPARNPEGSVPEGLRSDADGILTVVTAEMAPGNGAYELVWTLTNGVRCVNCAFVEARVKAIIADVLEQSFSDAISEVRGADPARIAAADYAGRGWQAEFVTDRETGDQIVAYVTACSSDACRPAELRIGELIWQNKVFTSAGCGDDFDELSGADAYGYSLDELPASVRASAGVDRVVIASPAFRPVLRAGDGGFVVDGWIETGCGS